MNKTRTNKKRINKKITIMLISIILLVLIMTFTNAIIAYYNPNSTISNGWSQGTGTGSHAEITDTARQPTAPNINTFVATRSNAVETSEFGFPNVIEQNVVNITLWVYTDTGTSAQYTFSLRQGANTMCSTIVPINTAIGWQSCTWSSVTGDLSDLRIHLSAATRPLGGGPTNAIVYAAYLEIDTGPEPPNVTLISPENDITSLNEPTNFSFNVKDYEYSTIANCTLYTNFTGTWGPNQTITNIANNTDTTFNITENDNYYEWNVYCENEFGRGAFAENNRTVYLNMKPPSITNYELNETSIRQNRTVKFNASITDYYGVDTATITLKYPNATETTYELNRNGNEFYYEFTNTIEEGIYEVINIWANDTRQKAGQINPEISFEVIAIPPTAFNLVYPINNYETKNLTPRMEWEQTTTPDFKNYTIQISKNQNFEIVQFTYYITNIEETEQQLTQLDDNTNYYWRVIAYDLFENYRISNQEYVYITDNTAPNTTLNQPEHNAYTNKTRNTFIFTPSDTNTITQCVLYSNTTGTWTTHNQTNSVMKNQENELEATFEEGRNAWNIRCYDDASNDAYSTNNNTLIVDLTPPKLNLVNPGNETTIYDSNIITFEFNVSDELSDIQSCSLIINETIEETKYNITNNEVNKFEKFLLNNYYSWSVTCKDINGWENATDTWFFNIDSLDEDPPVITLNYPYTNDYVNTSSIIFDYYLEDASQILNCTLYINNTIADISYDIETFKNNNFSMTGFEETNYNWKVQCYDEHNNQGNSSNRNYYVDLTNPEVILNTPTNNTWTKESIINFNYYVNDTKLDHCELYTNESGTFEVRQTQTNPLSEENNTMVRSMPEGTHTWNIKCHDLSNRNSFAEKNQIVNIDLTPPKYANENAEPESSNTYAPGTQNNFSIEWTDNIGIDTIIFEHNFTGTKTNNTPSNEGNTYWYTMELSAGNYYYKWYANDTVNNKNNTQAINYVVLKNTSELNLYLEGGENNITINENTLVNITAQINNPSNGFIELYLNNEKINEGTNTITNMTLFELPGTYNVSTIFTETTNYTRSEKNLTITVLDTIVPNVTLIYPENNEEITIGLRGLQYNVTDASMISYCALYINNTLEQNDTTITREETQNFFFEAEENTYTWRVECQDSYGNKGVSNTWTFTAIDVTIINVYINTSKKEYEQGEPININTTTTDYFDDSLITNIETGIITGNTTTPWWNQSWKKRRNIIMNETTGQNINQGVAEINITNINNLTSCETELRIIKQDEAKLEETVFVVMDAGMDWCFVYFEATIDANTNNKDYYVYYGNNDSPAPQELSLIGSFLFNAQEAAGDEGTTTNPNNIIGKNDDTNASMQVQQGGGTISAHGRALINKTIMGTIEQVQIRYRYAVPEAASLNWAMRYSIDGGTTYANAYTGTTTVAKTTSPWYNITSNYTLLTWNALNNTRLQGRMVKSGGGNPATVELYWVEMNVTYEKIIELTDTSVLEEEKLIQNSSGATNINGLHEWTWDTKNDVEGNYTIYSLAKRTNYENGKNTKFIIITPDVTPPNITLISPENNSKQEKGIINLTYNVFDYNLDRCTLHIGTTGLIENETDEEMQNGENTFQITLNYEEYMWNVQCYDKNNNNATAQNNYTFIIRVPDPEPETTILANNTLNVTWHEEPDAEYYNVYVTTDYEAGFPGIPNFTIESPTNFQEDITEEDKKFYKITMVSNGRESEIGGQIGLYSQTLRIGYNMISLPFLLNNYELENGENNGFKFHTNNSCLLSLWEYNATTNEFKKTDWINNAFVPSTGSEDFTTLNALSGYFLEANTTCKIKVAGSIPLSNETHDLKEDNNLVSWLTVKEKELPTNKEPVLINTEPTHAVTLINRFNSTNQTYETTSHWFEDGEPWGWWSTESPHFTSLVPMEAYYFYSTTIATWNHEPQ